MNILVLNKNIVVSKLISLSIKDFDVNITEEESLSHIEVDRYDIIFIDDSVFDNRVVKFLNSAISPIKIILYTNENDNLKDLNYDFKIKKPFLPLSIVNILNEVIKQEPKEFKDVNDLSVLLDYDDTKIDKLIENSTKSQGDSIKNIFLNETDNDLSNENLFDGREKKSEVNMNGNELLELLLDTKLEALKDVFAGAKINITIEFPKEDNI